MVLQEHKVRAGRRRQAQADAGACHSWASTLRSCCTMLPYVSVNTSALILSIFWNACSPIREKFLPAAIALFFCFLSFFTMRRSIFSVAAALWPVMFADVRALQELKNFDSQFVEGVKGVSMCQFVNKDAETKVYDVCPIVPWTCPSGQLPYNSLDERKLIADFQGSPEPSTGGLPGKCKVAPPLRSTDGELQDA